MQELQLDFFEVPSPCKGVCKSDVKGYCQGCFRTREERFKWIDLTNPEKQRVIKLCQQREKRRNQSTVKEKVIEPNVELIQPSLLDFQPSDNLDTSISESDFDDFDL